MAKTTGISWTDSTFSSWWGCTKVNDTACAHCWAEGVDKRVGGGHWGHGSPRRQTSEHTRNEPFRWNRAADKFFAEHGRRQRVFTLSMGDLFDNEVPDEWRSDHMGVMEACERLEWQICTKRVSNIPKMIWPRWEEAWPPHIGVLITVVTRQEASRDIPRLRDLKKRFGIPWIGVSYEPAQEFIDFAEHIGVWWNATTRRWVYEPKPGESYLDWIIFGGKSGPNWDDRPFDLEWARRVAEMTAPSQTAFFMKQVAAFRPTDAMIPSDLMIRQWPKEH